MRTGAEFEDGDTNGTNATNHHSIESRVGGSSRHRRGPRREKTGERSWNEAASTVRDEEKNAVGVHDQGRRKT